MIPVRRRRRLNSRVGQPPESYPSPGPSLSLLPLAPSLSSSLRHHHPPRLQPNQKDCSFQFRGKDKIHRRRKGEMVDEKGFWENDRRLACCSGSCEVPLN